MWKLIIYLTFFMGFLVSCSGWADTASDAAIQAALIQTGLADTSTKIQVYIENKARTVVRNLGLESPVVCVLFVHQTIKNKEISFGLGRERVHLHPDSIQIEIPL